MDSHFSLRPDFERIRKARREARSAERLSAHFEVERSLASRLAASKPEERTSLYANLYRQLFESVPDHPQHTGGRSGRAEQIRGQLAMLGRWLTPASTYVEIGCGDAALTKAVAGQVRQAIGIDVTEMLVGKDAPPPFRFVRTDGVALDLPAGSADLVYSNQLMEHLHDDDALAQLREIYRILKPGGRYVCSTPNRLTGPHDISVYFGHEPAGFHLREYDHRSLRRMFADAGFRRVNATASKGGRLFVLPVSLLAGLEQAIEALPLAWRARLAETSLVANLLGLTLVGTK